MVTQRELNNRIADKIANAEISQCLKCYCMTKTFNNKCGKCGSWKFKKSGEGEKYVE